MVPMGSLSNTERLTEDNYELWKMHMKSILIFYDLLTLDSKKWYGIGYNKYVHPTKSIVSYQKRKKIIAKEAWNKLQMVYESKGPARKAKLYKELMRLIKKHNVTMLQHINEFEKNAEELAPTNIQLPGDLLSIMALASLPPEFENFRKFLEF